MHDALQRDRWNHTAMLRATMVNLKADKGSQVSLQDMHPMLKTPERWENIKHQIFRDNGNGVRPKH